LTGRGGATALKATAVCVCSVSPLGHEVEPHGLQATGGSSASDVAHATAAAIRCAGAPSTASTGRLLVRWVFSEYGACRGNGGISRPSRRCPGLPCHDGVRERHGRGHVALVDPEPRADLHRHLGPLDHRSLAQDRACSGPRSPSSNTAAAAAMRGVTTRNRTEGCRSMRPRSRPPTSGASRPAQPHPVKTRP
jgi:hypothetical protein